MAPNFLFPDYAASNYLLFCLIFGLGSMLSMPFVAPAMKYSKFASDKGRLGTIPSKPAMFLFYAPPAAIAASVLCFKTLGFPDLQTLFKPQASSRFLVLNAALVIHFLKRVFEVLFVHKYSGNAEVLTSAVVIVFYSYMVGNVLYSQEVSESLPQPPVNLIWGGIPLFLFGIVGNFYHHSLLAKLRSEKSDKKYKVPQGGLFNLVACPHYLFEIIDFLGMALISQTVTSFLIFLTVLVNLGSRSISTRQWYLKKVDGFPEDRKAIIPFLL